MIYKLKLEDGKFLKFKTISAPHGNEDSIKHDLQSECSLCSPVGMGILLSIDAVVKLNIFERDLKTAFLQTGEAIPEIFVIPCKRSKLGKVIWFLFATPYV